MLLETANPMNRAGKYIVPLLCGVVITALYGCGQGPPVTAARVPTYVKASTPGEGDRFGFSLALSGDGNIMAVGAVGEDSAATGIGGNQADNSEEDAGAVYLFARNNAWSQQAYLKASNTGADDQFGFVLAVSDDGNTLAVGAPLEDSTATGINGNQADNSAGEAGAVYVFGRSGSSWAQQAYVKASNAGAGDRFGSSLALSADGNTLVVGARNEASAATGVNGNQASNTAPGAGAAYVFTRTGGSWSQQAYLKASNTGASDGFATSLAVSSDGSTLVVGAPLEDGSAKGINGNQADNSAEEAGAAYVFARSGGQWTQQAYVKASNAGANDEFGVHLALSRDGNTLAIGAAGEFSAAKGVNGDQADDSAGGAGAAYVLVRSGGAWSQQAYVKASNTRGFDEFGISVALSGDGNKLVVGAFGEQGTGKGLNAEQVHSRDYSDAGAAYVFARSGGAWLQQAYVKATNTEPFDEFGVRVALSSDGNTLAVSADLESGAGSGIGGNQDDNGAAESGAVYLY
jgi:hypothetical protein